MQYLLCPFALLQYRSYGAFYHWKYCLALTREMLKEYSWIKQSFALSNIIYGGMFIGAGLCAGEIFPSVSYNLLLVFLSGAAFFCHAREMMLYVAALFLLTALPQPFWLLVALLVSVLRRKNCGSDTSWFVWNTVCRKLVSYYLFICKCSLYRYYKKRNASFCQ